MRNRKLATLALSAATALAGTLATAPSAGAAACDLTSGADDCTAGVNVSTVVALPGTDGTRTIATSTVGAAGVLVDGVPSVMSVSVVETAKRGGNWSVTAVASDMTSAGGVTIPASSLAMGAATAPSAVGCLSVAILSSRCTVSGGAGGTLEAARTVFDVTGELNTVSYTGTYVGTAPVTLTLPSGTPTGTYNGTVTLTLVQ